MGSGDLRCRDGKEEMAALRAALGAELGELGVGRGGWSLEEKRRG